MRVAIGGVQIDKSLARGQYRQLTDEEIESLLAAPSSSATAAPGNDGP